MRATLSHAEYSQGFGRGYGGAAGVQRGVGADTDGIKRECCTGSGSCESEHWRRRRTVLLATNHDQRKRVSDVDARHAPPEERSVSVPLEHVWELLRPAVQRDTCDSEEWTVSVPLEHVRKLLRGTDRESCDGDLEERTVSVPLEHVRKLLRGTDRESCDGDLEERTVSVPLEHVRKLLRGTDRESCDGDLEERTVSVPLEHVRKLLRGTDRECRDGDPEERSVSVPLEHVRKLLRLAEVGWCGDGDSLLAQEQDNSTMDELMRWAGASTCSVFEAAGGARFLQEIGCLSSGGEWVGDTWLIGLFTVFVLFFFLFGGGGFFFFSGGD